MVLDECLLRIIQNPKISGEYLDRQGDAEPWTACHLHGPEFMCYFQVHKTVTIRLVLIAERPTLGHVEPTFSRTRP